MTEEKRNELLAISIVAAFVCVAAICYLIGSAQSQSDFEAEYERGFQAGQDSLDVYEFWTFIDSTNIYDSVFNGTFIRHRIKVPRDGWPQPWDQIDPTDTMPAVELELHPDAKPMPDSIWDSFRPYPHQQPIDTSRDSNPVIIYDTLDAEVEP